MENLKVSKFWVFRLIGQLLFICFFLYLMVFLVPKFESPEASIFWFKSVLTTLFFLVSCFFAFSFLETYNNEGKYVEKLMIPAKQFGLEIYDNVYIFSLEGIAWTVDRKYSKVLESKEIKVIKYYNKNRECVEIKPDLPYRLGV